MSTAVVIVAAGRGTRASEAGDALPKQYRRLAGVPVLTRTLGAFARHPAIAGIVSVIHPEDRDHYDAAAAPFAGRLLAPVPGGATRQESVLAGLEALHSESPASVLIHDAARPFVSAGVIDRVTGALERSDGALPALAVADTLKRGAGGAVAETVERAGLWAAQTPQGFRYDAIVSAHHAARAAQGHTFTDDASIAEWHGMGVALVEGEAGNMKLTTADDFALAEQRLAAGETRVGQGFDVHAFEAGDHVLLCGVRIPHDKSLAGHSDADVGLHAVTDALLGAVGEGDIGSHFPPSDPRWRGASSAIFLRDAAARVQARGGALVHVDVTLICERPKIGPHREAMRDTLAALLDTEPARVSVKATTTEGLGFTGRGEGIAALATATVRLP